MFELVFCSEFGPEIDKKVTFDSKESAQAEANRRNTAIDQSQYCDMGFWRPRKKRITKTR